MSIPAIAVKFTIIDLLSKGIGTIKNNLLSLSSANKEVQKSFDNMNRSMKYAAFAGIATREIYKSLKPAVGVAGDLQEEMIGVRSELMGSGKDAARLNAELKKIKGTAFSVQAWTPFDMSQIVALEKELIKAGARTKDITGKSGAAAAAAALGTYENLNPVETGKALIGIGTPFRIAADGYMQLADMISRASSASTTGAAEIVEAAKYAAGPMAALGRSSTEMLAFAASMAQIGIDSGMAGTAIKAFFSEAAKFKIFRDERGNLLPTVEIIAKLRTMLKGLGEAKRQVKLEKMFGERGMQVGLALLNEGKGSYEEIVKAMDESASLQDKLSESMKGFNKQMESLKGTSKSVIADLFQPALAPLSAIIAKVNSLMSLIGEASQKKESLAKIVSGTSLGALGAGALATAALTGAGLFYGRKVLKGVGGIKGLFKGMGSSAAGIATGKAVEAATGVTPVFVTNWPGYISGGTSADVLGGATAGAALNKYGPSIIPFLKKAGIIGGLFSLGLTDVGKIPFKFLDERFSGASKWLTEKTGIGESMQKHQNNININLRIDKNGRTFSDTNDMNTHLSLETGDFFK